MHAELINPFINATLNVLSTMCSLAPVAGVPIEKDNNKTWGDVTGVIGLAGTSVMGSMMVSFEEKAALHIASKMLMEDYLKVNQEVIDAIGEITNIITGGAKRELSEMDMVIEMALPMVITGQGVEISQHVSSRFISIPFTFPEGNFVVEAGLTKR